MKQTKQFDYSKFSKEQSWCNPEQKDPACWGLHEIDGKLHIDIARYKKVCNEIGITDFIPKEWESVSERCFIPDKTAKYDYKVNLFRDLIQDFKDDWFQEYKPIFQLIRTPEQVRQDVRLGGLAMISAADDIESVDEDAFLAMARRYGKYNEIIQSLYCSFISKLSTEIDRYTLIVMCELGYKGKDYSFDSFRKFSDGLQNDKSGIRISQLKKYNSYNLLHKVNNFLKHNTLESYNTLKRFYPDNVRSVEKGTSKQEYENGMFAGDWIVLKENYIDSLLDKLIQFFEDYCIQFLKENLENAKWNYNDYFLNAIKEMRNPHEYFGLP